MSPLHYFFISDAWTYIVCAVLIIGAAVGFKIKLEDQKRKRRYSKR